MIKDEKLIPDEFNNVVLPDNYLKFDSNLYNTSFMPKDLSSFEVKNYNYSFLISFLFYL